MQKLSVQAIWDNQANVWVAESDDIPGLATEAETLEALTGKLRVMVPELLEANGIHPTTHDLPFHLTAKRTEHIAV